MADTNKFIVRIATIAYLGSQFFNSAEEFSRWLSNPQEVFLNQPPFMYAADEEGYQAIIDWLTERGAKLNRGEDVST